jgi:hypothetical protein
MTADPVLAAFNTPGFELTTWRHVDIGDTVRFYGRGANCYQGVLEAASFSWSTHGERVNIMVNCDGLRRSDVVTPGSPVERRLADGAATARIRAAIERQHDVPVPPWPTLAGQRRRADDRLARRIDRGRFPVISWGHGVAVLLGAAIIGGIILAGAAIALAFIV